MSIHLSERFERAARFAVRAHAGQLRKGSQVPYICHPLAVASLVLEYGGTETQAIAALLHDVIEDCGVKELELKRHFGGAVARIVRDCSDHAGNSKVKPSWKSRKVTYLAHLEKEAHPTSLLVSASDKLHNARSILHDVRHRGPQVWMRFSASRSEVIWYYASLVRIYKKQRGPMRAEFSVLVRELAATVRELRKMGRG